MQLKNYIKNRIDIRKCLLALGGILLIGIGVAFNAMAQLGNDPVGIFYDGIRNVLGLSKEQLGIASNLVNVVLAVFLFFFGRRYLNIGTFIYIIPYGLCVDIGTFLYSKIFAAETFACRIMASVTGCLLLYTGVGLYIAVDIGMDPMTGTAMVIKDRLKWDFKKAKWLFDGSLIVIGFLLGGTLGAVTILTAVTAGPAIQYIAEKVTGVGRWKQDT